MTQPYVALALQLACRSVNALAVGAAREQILREIARMGAKLAAAKRFLGRDVRLVTLPEYAFTGFPWGESPAEWRAKAVFAPEGPEYEALAKIAAENEVYLATNQYETDARFPALYFQACTILTPAGATALRYRRLISMFAPSPFDVWDAYLDAYGLAGVFPVADTELGRLGAVASEEILYPELARALVSRGAEVLLHPSSEVSSPEPTPKAIARRARAVENLAYVVSANTGGLEGLDIPANSTDGGSEILDWQGRILAKAGPGESINAAATLDIAALRHWRRRPGMSNLLSRHPIRAWAQAYAQAEGAEPNLLGSGEQAPDRDFYHSRQQRVLAKLDAANLL